MSGGSWDYFYSRLDEIALRLLHENHSSEPELRRALGRLLRKVVTALHDIEWVDSCDYGKGDEREALLAVFEDRAPRVVLEDLSIAVDELRARVDAEIERQAGI